MIGCETAKEIWVKAQRQSIRTWTQYSTRVWSLWLKVRWVIDRFLWQIIDFYVQFTHCPLDIPFNIVHHSQEIVLHLIKQLPTTNHPSNNKLHY